MDLNEKIKILNIDNERLELIKSLPFESIESDKSKTIKLKKQIINVDDIVGIIDRPMDDAINWLELLDGLHKSRNFKIYNEDTFQDILLNFREDDLPSVFLIDENYYISGNGKHRLTIAKCLGGLKAKVIVNEY